MSVIFLIQVSRLLSFSFRSLVCYLSHSNFLSVILLIPPFCLLSFSFRCLVSVILRIPVSCLLSSHSSFLSVGLFSNVPPFLVSRYSFKRGRRVVSRELTTARIVGLTREGPEVEGGGFPEGAKTSRAAGRGQTASFTTSRFSRQGCLQRGITKTKKQHTYTHNLESSEATSERGVH